MAKSKEKKANPAPVQRQAKVEKATFKYIFENDYNPVYANGAYGGPTTQGEIAINFYVERNPVPLAETVAIGQDGKVGETIKREPELEDGGITVIRYITTGVVMSRETARRVHEFLGRHLQNLETMEAVKQIAKKAAKKD